MYREREIWKHPVLRWECLSSPSPAQRGRVNTVGSRRDGQEPEFQEEQDRCLCELQETVAAHAGPTQAQARRDASGEGNKGSHL